VAESERLDGARAHLLRRLGWIGLTFFRLSTSQDGTKDPKLTLKAESLAPAATWLFGFTLTGAAFDWLMSLLPTWYSTIYGVTIFAGSVVMMYATLILVTLSLRSAGTSSRPSTSSTTTTWGSSCSASWSSGRTRPRSVHAHLVRGDSRGDHVLPQPLGRGPWMYVSLGIVILHFVVPFFILLSRNVKRRLGALAFGAAWLIAMHIVEMYWQVMPNFGGGRSPSPGSIWRASSGRRSLPSSRLPPYDQAPAHSDRRSASVTLADVRERVRH